MQEENKNKNKSLKLQITDAEIILDWLQARIDLNGCAPQHLHKTLIQLHVSTMSPCLDVQCQFPWGLLHFNLFIPTTTETRSKSKCKRINVNGKHALHMALFHKLLHYHTHAFTVGSRAPTTTMVYQSYIFFVMKRENCWKGNENFERIGCFHFCIKYYLFTQNFRD
jgi:hypothetical protein